MTDNVIGLLNQLLVNNFPSDTEGALIIKKIIASGIDNLDTNEVTAFSQLVLPVIRNHSCECWSCHVNVADEIIDDFYEFLKSGLCPVCNEIDLIRDGAAL